MGALDFAIRILAVRVILLVAIVGAILLTWQTLADPQIFRVIAISAYMGLIVLPVVWLSAAGK